MSKSQLGFESQLHTHIERSVIVFTFVAPFYSSLTLGHIDISLQVNCCFSCMCVFETESPGWS